MATESYMPAIKLAIKIVFLEELLGSLPNNPGLLFDWVVTKGPDAEAAAEEKAAVPVDVALQKMVTVFARDIDGTPMLWDYVIKGYFKDACGMLSRVPGSKSSNLPAYKKVIDGLVFADPRRIRLELPIGEALGLCTRPIRCPGAQGEKTAIACSETAPADTTFTTEITVLGPQHLGLIREWLNYGVLRGLGQWRNSGKGRFVWEELSCVVVGKLEETAKPEETAKVKRVPAKRRAA